MFKVESSEKSGFTFCYRIFQPHQKKSYKKAATWKEMVENRRKKQEEMEKHRKKQEEMEKGV